MILSTKSLIADKNNIIEKKKDTKMVIIANKDAKKSRFLSKYKCNCVNKVRFSQSTNEF